MEKNYVIGYALIVLAVILCIAILYFNGVFGHTSLVFSDKDMVTSLWSHYKSDYINPDGRAIDKSQNNITTSEGQGYLLLRAVWMDDKGTFDKGLQWTNNNLKHKDDNLFAWLFGEKTDGSYGILTDRGGQNAATDADTDIALALVFAYDRWNDTKYLTEAKAIMGDIWDKEVVVIAGKPYLTANNLEKFSSSKPIINPSYFEPYAYRIFANIDRSHDWVSLVDTSYALLNNSASSQLDKGSSSGLPPDWIEIDKTKAAISATGISNLTTNFSFDALRVPWRVALDYEWFKAPEAKQYLDKLGFLSSQWQNSKMLASVYGHDGSIVASSEVPAMYGGAIGYFAVSDTADADDVYNQKLKILFDQDTENWKTPLSYYDANWAWFGIALYDNLLPNLSSGISYEK